mmetsp:Transcript_4130/g.6464  ORF Transcript_4130/g.6464 Transcript_4130/m.6464 type:complete len:120 (+) Transcript_4130:175-534(+)
MHTIVIGKPCHIGSYAMDSGRLGIRRHWNQSDPRETEPPPGMSNTSWKQCDGVVIYLWPKRYGTSAKELRYLQELGMTASQKCWEAATVHGPLTLGKSASSSIGTIKSGIRCGFTRSGS